MYNKLCYQFPGSFIRPLPDKNYLEKLKKDDSDSSIQRRADLDHFLRKIIEHRRLGTSGDLQVFLREQDDKFTEIREQEDKMNAKSTTTMAKETIGGVFGTVKSAGKGLLSYAWNRGEEVKT